MDDFYGKWAVLNCGVYAKASGSRIYSRAALIEDDKMPAPKEHPVKGAKWTKASLPHSFGASVSNEHPGKFELARMTMTRAIDLDDRDKYLLWARREFRQRPFKSAEFREEGPALLKDGGRG